MLPRNRSALKCKGIIMRKKFTLALDVLKTLIGTALFALGFCMFLEPNDLNVGGVSGIAMLIVEVLGVGSIGVVSVLINLPLFIIAGLRVGKRFFWGSLLGMASLSLFIDLFALLPVPETESLVGALYGGVCCGIGAGLVFISGHSTGGSDIVVRLMKKKWQHVPIGIFITLLDLVIAALTAFVFENLSQALYCGVTIFVTGRVVDAVVYSFDYSKVALIVTPKHQQIAQRLGKELHRGATFLDGEGSYSRKATKVVLTAVKKHQIAELKRIVVEEDPDAFIIVQEAHQVLGDGFLRYNKDSL